VPLDGVALHLEPGRALQGDDGVHLATVRAVTRATEPLKWKHLAPAELPLQGIASSTAS
jgi:diaminopimelate decarboxylase